jgi:hypothetical protein
MVLRDQPWHEETLHSYSTQIERVSCPARPERSASMASPHMIAVGGAGSSGLPAFESGNFIMMKISTAMAISVLMA